MTDIKDHKTFWIRSTMEIITYTEGNLADIIQLARKDILSLITTIESQNSVIDEYQFWIENIGKPAQVLIESQKEEIETIKRRMERLAETSVDITELESLRAITELAVKGLNRVMTGGFEFPQTRNSFIEDTLSEIERLTNGTT